MDWRPDPTEQGLPRPGAAARQDNGMFTEGWDAMMGLRVVVRAYPWRGIPWHRKKRIAKKWAKRRGPRREYLPVNPRDILHDPQRGILYCYPAMAREIETMLKSTP